MFERITKYLFMCPLFNLQFNLYANLKGKISAYWWQAIELKTCENQFFGHRILQFIYNLYSLYKRIMIFLKHMWLPFCPPIY